MFSASYSARERSGTSQSFLGNKDLKRKSNASTEMPQPQVELQQREQQKSLLTGTAMSGICISADQIK